MRARPQSGEHFLPCGNTAAADSACVHRTAECPPSSWQVILTPIAPLVGYCILSIVAIPYLVADARASPSCADSSSPANDLAVFNCVFGCVTLAWYALLAAHFACVTCGDRESHYEPTEEDKAVRSAC